MKDYYAILGISVVAEVEVISAAYKALAKKYHPDVFKGSQKDAQHRIREINEAYSNLSNKSKRETYDKDFLNNKSTGSFDDFNNSEFDDNSNVFDDDWNILIEIFPDAENFRLNLSHLSQKLGFLFQVVLLEKQLGGKAQQVAQNLKIDFLERYFGKNRDIQELAAKALLYEEIEIAKEINKKIVLLGDDASKKIYSTLSTKLEKIITQKNKKSSSKKTAVTPSSSYSNEFSKPSSRDNFITIGFVSIIVFIVSVLIINNTTFFRFGGGKCNQNPHRCNDEQLCSYATEVINNKLVWADWTKEWADVAKEKGLTCNIGLKK